jgi:hypothetical protein
MSQDVSSARPCPKTGPLSSAGVQLLDPTDDIWAALVNSAQDHAPCTAIDATCRVVADPGPLYVLLFHSDDRPHSCEVCGPEVLPQYLISVETWQTTRRDALVARLARWLGHCHHQGMASA